MPKRHKVEEPAGAYTTAPKRAPRPTALVPKAPDSSEVRYLDEATARKLADKVFAERKELLRKLAQ